MRVSGPPVPASAFYRYRNLHRKNRSCGLVDLEVGSAAPKAEDPLSELQGLRPELLQ